MAQRLHLRSISNGRQSSLSSVDSRFVVSSSSVSRSVSSEGGRGSPSNGPMRSDKFLGGWACSNNSFTICDLWWVMEASHPAYVP